MKYFIGLLLLPVVAMANDGKLLVQTVAQKELVVVNEQGEPETQLVSLATVVPGDEVIYTISFINNGNAPAKAVMITDPVPEQMRYIDGSAFSAGSEVQFSVDGGENWDLAERLSVTGDDGSVRPARAGDYTHIRWTLRNPIAPGKRGYARFKAALR